MEKVKERSFEVSQAYGRRVGLRGKFRWSLAVLENDTEWYRKRPKKEKDLEGSRSNGCDGAGAATGTDGDGDGGVGDGGGGKRFEYKQAMRPVTLTKHRQERSVK
uniref:Uncharacterized protein n=1 Tax=Vespula pensylvanica TaxID=30213 RepID=A0A834PAJ5_VESPE|nr:hypothetical protein H0235_002697 [Vespula pensylvanica]